MTENRKLQQRVMENEWVKMIVVDSLDEIDETLAEHPGWKEVGRTSRIDGAITIKLRKIP